MHLTVFKPNRNAAGLGFISTDLVHQQLRVQISFEFVTAATAITGRVYVAPSLDNGCQDTQPLRAGHCPLKGRPDASDIGRVCPICMWVAL